jgi:hypothetical protein
MSMSRPCQLAFALPRFVADDFPRVRKRREKRVPFDQERCPACDGSVTDIWHQTEIFEGAANSNGTSPVRICRCQELDLLGLFDLQSVSKEESGERNGRRLAERRSNRVRRKARHRRAAERRVSMSSARVNHRSGVDRRAANRRAIRDQRRRNDRRTYVWVRERGAWMIVQSDVSPQQPK